MDRLKAEEDKISEKLNNADHVTRFLIHSYHSKLGMESETIMNSK